MRRDLSGLTGTEFDLLVVGAGIHGACAAWDASLRGLSVAIVDQGDFGAATSANSLRIVHGGLRYLARGKLTRMRESIRERSTLLHIAPGLVEPLPVLMPVYGLGTPGRLALRAALALNDLASSDRNRRLRPDRGIPPGRVVSRTETLGMFPGVTEETLSGGALWYDAQVCQPERLILSFVQAASTLGAVPANYVRVAHLLAHDDYVIGALVVDGLTGTELEIRARTLLVAAGPWTQELISTLTHTPPPVATSRDHALGLNLVLRRRLAEIAVGVRTRSTRGEDPVGGGDRFLFFTPQGKATLLGTWYTLADRADIHGPLESGRRLLLEEVNEACPRLRLTGADVVRCQWGWLPLKAGRERGRVDALAERARVVDHGRAGGPHRLISVEGVKYTTARLVAERSVDLIFRCLGRRSPACRSSEVRLPEADTRPSLEPGSSVTEDEILRVTREEMAVKLGDIVFRRTVLGAAPGPERAMVEQAARVAGAELGWDGLRQEAEIEAVMREAGVPGRTLEPVA